MPKKQIMKVTANKSADVVSIREVVMLSLSDSRKRMVNLIIPAYILIAIFTPALAALDRNAVSFLALALLNLLVFIGFVSIGFFRKNPEPVRGFFKNPAGWLYTAFVSVALAGIFLSDNRVESILQCTKIVTVYVTVFIICMSMIKASGSSVKHIVFIMTGMLFLEAAGAFFQCCLVFTGQLESLLDVTFIYSNKNILAAAVFLKLPFALWLILFESGAKKIMGCMAFAAGVGALILLGARTFYLGLMILSVIFMAWRVLMCFRNNGEGFLRGIVIRFGAVSAGILILGVSCFWLSPEISDIRPANMIFQHLMSAEKIKTAYLRLDSWQWSWELIKKYPWFGVGAGNWKAAVLEHENQKNPGFVYLCRAHNDFLEIMAETGIVGGLLFIGLYMAVLRQFVCCCVHQGPGSGVNLKYHFLAAAGILCYSVDAFFNFPADRPELMILVAIFLSISIASDFRRKQGAVLDADRKSRTTVFIDKCGFFVNAAVISVLAGACWVLYLNFQSSRTQRIVYQEIHSGHLTQKAKVIAAGFPFMPNISLWGEPVAVLKARYFIHEKQFEAAIDLLLNDRSSPYDSRREFFLAMAFHRIGKHEIALNYSEAALQLKPNYFEHLLMTVLLLEDTGNYQLATRYCDTYLANNPTEKRAWILTADLHIKRNALKKAAQVIDRALTYFPREKKLLWQQMVVQNNRHGGIINGCP